MENSVVVSDYTQMDRILREERKYVLDICKKVQKTGCNVLLVQKSILRDAVSDLSLHFLAKMKILVVRDIERDEIEFISKTLNCRPIASVDALAPEKLGSAGLVQEISTGESKIVQITEVPNIGKTVSVLVRGSNKLVRPLPRPIAPPPPRSLVVIVVVSIPIIIIIIVIIGRARNDYSNSRWSS